MRARTLGLLVVSAAVAAACSAPAQREFSRADQDAIRKLVQDFVAAYNAKDLQKVGTFFSANAVLMPANRAALRGVDLLKTYYEDRFRQGATNLQIEPQDVSGQGSLGYIAARFSFEVPASESGGPAIHDHGKVLWIVRSFNNQWKFEYQIMSSDLPTPAPMPGVAAAAEKK